MKINEKKDRKTGASTKTNLSNTVIVTGTFIFFYVTFEAKNIHE
jgi:hypothetical protein